MYRRGFSAVKTHPCHKFSTGIIENFSIEKWGITDVRWSSPPSTYSITQCVCVCKIANYVISYKMAAESKEWMIYFIIIGLFLETKTGSEQRVVNYFLIRSEFRVEVRKLFHLNSTAVYMQSENLHFSDILNRLVL